MKLTLANIKELKRNSDSPLLKRVCNYVIDRWSDYNDKKGIFTDVLHYGCNRELSENLSTIRIRCASTNSTVRRSIRCCMTL